MYENLKTTNQMSRYFWFGLILCLAFASYVAAQSRTISNQKPAAKYEKSIQKSIKAYFDWQYDATLNGVRQANRRRPLVASDQSQEFLQKKEDFLEVAAFNDETNAVKVLEHELVLEFVDLRVAEDDFATVKVLENYHRRYEYSDVFVDGTTTHLIDLRRNGRSWEIVADKIEGTDAPPDDFDKDNLIEEIRQESAFRKDTERDFLQKAGITQEFVAQENYALRNQGLSEKQADDKLKEIVNQKANDYVSQKEFVENLSSNRLTNRTYNRQAAQDYINRWAYSRNAAWGNFDNLGGDCTNWISQIIYAGGIPKDTSDTYKWFYNSMNDRAPSWTGVKELWTYVVGNSDGNGYNGPQASFWTNSAGRANMYTGDFIQLYRSSNGWFHTYGVNRVEWVKQCPWYNPLCGNWVFKIYVTSHYSDRRDDDLDRSDVGGRYPTKRYAHIIGWRAQ